jgi:hypothetical protein
MIIVQFLNPPKKKSKGDMSSIGGLGRIFEKIQKQYTSSI